MGRLDDRAGQVRAGQRVAGLLLAMAWLGGPAVGGARAADDANPFELPVPRVESSPATPSRVAVPAGWRVEALAMAPSSAEVAVLLSRGETDTDLELWRAGEPSLIPTGIRWPSGFRAGAAAGDKSRTTPLAWHPFEHTVYVAGAIGSHGMVLAVAQHDRVWSVTKVAETASEIRSLAIGPRPYVTAWDPEKREVRLFFGVVSGKSVSIRSLTENGTKPYEAIAPAAPAAKRKGAASEDAVERPSEIAASWADPEAFHPAGHLLVWRDDKSCHHVAIYDRDAWKKQSALATVPCGGSVQVTPNGAGLVQWMPGSAGVTLFLDSAKSHETVAGDTTFEIAPSLAPDGGGLVGVVRTEGTGTDGTATALAFAPVSMPLADVVDAWMFASGAPERERLARDTGVFRPLALDQLYSLYDSERYECGNLDTAAPARPYLVTTDVFWEVFAAAYEGLFLVEEKTRAMPAFWRFVDEASKGVTGSGKTADKWRKVFEALEAVKAGDPRNAEAARIIDAKGKSHSDVLDADFDYAELTPRGHYTATPERRRYFQAFRYLAGIQLGDDDLRTLRALPEAAQQAARDWAAPYLEVEAPSRRELVWSPSQPGPDYARRSPPGPAVFPLGWGFDSEALDRTVIHLDVPAEEQIRGPKGPRALPSGLDVATALGSGFARSLLDEAGATADYPRLGPTLDELARAFASRQAHGVSGAANLYDAWLAALAVQWTDRGSMPTASGAHAPDAITSPRLWQVKRLQTGLASWATLRHATVLVNERSAAECGEGGFEPIVMDPPRGYVEPDPETFGAIAALFEQAAGVVSRSTDLSTVETSPVDEPSADSSHPSAETDVKLGLAKRLAASAAKARLFQSLARKELDGLALSPAEYQEIFDVGRVAEHHALVYRSLARDDLSLANPDPMAKVADVADGREAGGGLLLVGVGYPLEWDQIVPFFGRREIVKGPVYGYYETTRPAPLDDATWRKQVKSLARPSWVEPFLGAPPCDCAPPRPF